MPILLKLLSSQWADDMMTLCTLEELSTILCLVYTSNSFCFKYVLRNAHILFSMRKGIRTYLYAMTLVCFPDLPRCVLSSDVWKQHVVDLILCILFGLHMCKLAPLEHLHSKRSQRSAMLVGLHVSHCLFSPSDHHIHEGEVYWALFEQIGLVGKRNRVAFMMNVMFLKCCATIVMVLLLTHFISCALYRSCKVSPQLFQQSCWSLCCHSSWVPLMM